MSSSLEKSPLGKKSAYIDQYTPELLFPIKRKLKRDEINIPATLPFKGYDLWRAYELSWLNTKGKPNVALLTLVFPCESPFLIESKSLKLYLNSFNNSRFESSDIVTETIRNDLSNACGNAVEITLFQAGQFDNANLTSPVGTCLDTLDVTCDDFEVNVDLLKPESSDIIEEKLYSNLLKSNCLVTGQPDWGTLEIHYLGNKLHHENLLKYIVSYRNHNEFHEQCVERIFNDIFTSAKPEQLTVRAFYTRRGGLDINPVRSTEETDTPPLTRLFRQ